MYTFNNLINTRYKTTSLVRIPGHRNIQGEDKTDRASNRNRIDKYRKIKSTYEYIYTDNGNQMKNIRLPEGDEIWKKTTKY